MKCEEAGELIHAYLLGALDEDERHRLEAHIRGCPDCLALYYEESPSMEMLIRVGDPVPPPAGPEEAHHGNGQRRSAPARRDRC